MRTKSIIWSSNMDVVYLEWISGQRGEMRKRTNLSLPPSPSPYRQMKTAHKNQKRKRKSTMNIWIANNLQICRCLVSNELRKLKSFITSVAEGMEIYSSHSPFCLSVCRFIREASTLVLERLVSYEYLPFVCLSSQSTSPTSSSLSLYATSICCFAMTASNSRLENVLFGGCLV